MKTRKFIVLLALLGVLLATAAAQHARPQSPVDPSGEETTHKLPNGKSMEDEIVKADFKKAQEDAAQLVRLSQEVQSELEKNGSHVLSVALLKKLDEVEKCARRIRSRVRK